MTGTVVLHDDPKTWLEPEVSVLEFLAPSGIAVAPSPLIAPGPWEDDGLWMTFTEWIVGIATDLATGGYWLVGADGGVFAFNAPFYGSGTGIQP